MARLEELVRRIEANETGIDRLAGELKEAQRLVAVSYTHLDVYKRQPFILSN